LFLCAFFVFGAGDLVRFDPDIHQRHSIRLAGYDYSSAGFYFVTICVQGRDCLFGEVVEDRVVLNDAGRMVEHWWHEISNKFSTVGLDHYVIMPNHFHGIIILHPPDVGADLCVRPGSDSFPVGANLRVRPGFRRSEMPGGHTGPPLPTVVQWFKTMSTNAYIHGVNNHNWPPFPGKLWQRNYYERIIRNENELHNIRQYIHNNPAKWADDNENPANNP
jgi:putative transposase